MKGYRLHAQTDVCAPVATWHGRQGPRVGKYGMVKMDEGCRRRLAVPAVMWDIEKKKKNGSGLMRRRMLACRASLRNIDWYVFGWV